MVKRKEENIVKRKQKENKKEKEEKLKKERRRLGEKVPLQKNAKNKEINIGGSSLKEARNSLFSDIKLPTDNIKINFAEDGKIGDSQNFINNDILKNAVKKEKSESNDGFKKFNEIPVNTNVVPPKQPRMTYTFSSDRLKFELTLKF